MRVPPSVIQMITDLRTYLQEKIEPPVYVSDRRLVKAIQLLQVGAAWMLKCVQLGVVVCLLQVLVRSRDQARRCGPSYIAVCARDQYFITMQFASGRPHAFMIQQLGDPVWSGSHCVPCWLHGRCTKDSITLCFRSCFAHRSRRTATAVML